MDVLDNYGKRFHRLKKGQNDYVSKHHTIVFDLDEPYIQGRPGPPQRVPHDQLRAARYELVDGMYNFLLRLYRERILKEQDVRSICRDIGVGIDPRDFGS